jgi:hypothetical protein
MSLGCIEAMKSRIPISKAGTKAERPGTGHSEAYGRWRKENHFCPPQEKTHSIYCLNAVSLDAMRFIRGKNDF